MYKLTEKLLHANPVKKV